MTSPVITQFKDTVFRVITSWGSGSAITGVSNATQAVVNRVAHGHTVGDIVRHAGIVGMEELNGRICVVSAVTADTYTLSGVNSTNWGVYVSGGTVAEAVLSASCQVTGYQGATGTTPSSTTDTSCGSVKAYGVAQHGSVTVSFAESTLNAPFEAALKSARASVSQTALVTELPLARGRLIDIGTVVSYDSNASANGNWTGGAVIERDFPRIELAAEERPRMANQNNAALEALLAAVSAAAQSTQPRKLSIAGLGDVYVAPMSSEEWLNMREEPDLSPAEKKGWSIARWLSDEHGNRLVAQDNKAALAQFAKLPWQMANQILIAAGGSKNG